MHEVTTNATRNENATASRTAEYYFTNKRAILIATLETVMADLNRRLVKLLQGAPDAETRLRAVIKGCLALADEKREFWVVFVEFGGEMMHDEELLRVNATLYRQFRRTLGALVAQGIRAGLFRRVNPEEAGAIILAVVDSVSCNGPSTRRRSP